MLKNSLKWWKPLNKCHLHRQIPAQQLSHKIITIDFTWNETFRAIKFQFLSVLTKSFYVSLVGGNLRNLSSARQGASYCDIQEEWRSSDGRIWLDRLGNARTRESQWLRHLLVVLHTQNWLRKGEFLSKWWAVKTSLKMSWVRAVKKQILRDMNQSRELNLYHNFVTHFLIFFFASRTAAAVNVCGSKIIFLFVFWHREIFLQELIARWDNETRIYGFGACGLLQEFYGVFGS